MNKIKKIQTCESAVGDKIMKVIRTTNFFLALKFIIFYSLHLEYECGKFKWIYKFFYYDNISQF